MEEDNGIVPSSLTVDGGFWIRAATRRVRRYVGWHLAPSTQCKGECDTRGGLVIGLPLMHITAIRSIGVHGTDVTGTAKINRELGIIELDHPTPPGIAAVSYDVTAGWDPDDLPDVQQVILQAARRAASTPTGLIKSQSVNGSSVSYGFGSDGAAAITLLESEKELIDQYRIGARP